VFPSLLSSPFFCWFKHPLNSLFIRLLIPLVRAFLVSFVFSLGPFKYRVLLPPSGSAALPLLLPFVDSVSFFLSPFGEGEVVSLVDGVDRNSDFSRALPVVGLADSFGEFSAFLSFLFSIPTSTLVRIRLPLSRSIGCPLVVGSCVPRFDYILMIVLVVSLTFFLPRSASFSHFACWRGPPSLDSPSGILRQCLIFLFLGLTSVPST